MCECDYALYKSTLIYIGRKSRFSPQLYMAVPARILWLFDGEKCRRHVYSFRHNTRTWRTDGQTPHYGIARQKLTSHANSGSCAITANMPRSCPVISKHALNSSLFSYIWHNSYEAVSAASIPVMFTLASARGASFDFVTTHVGGLAISVIYWFMRMQRCAVLYCTQAFQLDDNTAELFLRGHITQIGDSSVSNCHISYNLYTRQSAASLALR